MSGEPKKRVTLVAAVLACMVVAAVWTLFWNDAGTAERPRVEVRRDGVVVASFAVEFATTREQQVQGLMGREHLAEDEGMLFIYVPEQRVGMWMKNMLIPLDFLFADAKGVVVHIVENVPPCPPEGACPTISAGVPVKYVLEVPAGTVARFGLQVGDVLRTVIAI